MVVVAVLVIIISIIIIIFIIIIIIIIITIIIIIIIIIIAIIIINLFHVDFKIVIFYNKKIHQDRNCTLCSVADLSQQKEEKVKAKNYNSPGT